jgi:nicotinate-nucleotide adenylyltransferase
MAAIGIFSGTFDPVHSGHIAFCRAAVQAATLEKVVLLPEAAPRGKSPVTSLAHRRAMLELATAADPHLEVLTLPDKRFSVARTLPRLQQLFAGHKLSLLVGSDVVQTFAHRWPGLETLLAEMELIIGLRAGDTASTVEGLLEAVQRAMPKLTLRYRLLDSPYAQAASSQIRSVGAVPAHLPPPVTAYIAAHRLYAERV